MNRRRAVTIGCALCLATLSLAASFDDLRRGDRGRREPLRRVGRDRPAVTSGALSALKDCSEVRGYLIDVAIERVVEARYNWWLMLPWAGPEGGRDVADVPSDYTTTNLQEAGVDEIDIVKTNGTHLYATEGDRLHVLESLGIDGRDARHGRRDRQSATTRSR